METTAHPAATTGTSAGPDVAHQATSIARQTMSPFCPGRTLYDCPSPNAAEWRRDIEAMLVSGKSAHEIQTELASRAEADLSGSPNSHASYLWSLVFLFVAVLGLILLFRRLRPRTPSLPALGEVSPSKADPPPAQAVVDDGRLDEELDGVH